MTPVQIALLSAVFLSVFAGAIGLMQYLTPGTVRGRLEALNGSTRPAATHEPGKWTVQFIRLTKPIAKLSVPEEGWKNSAIRARFMHAGFRSASAPAIFFTAKTLLAVSLPLTVFLVTSVSGVVQNQNATLAWLLVAAAIGYYAPNFVLKNLVARRQREIFESFPDALDLMTVCVEAGLGMDAALARVAAEIGLKSKILAEELHLVTLELRAGSAKEKALRNLALRTGVDDVHALVAMLIQAERFGTSIADSLRIQSDLLRTKRRQRAEEQAAKIALKLLFPLIFFIFPSLMVVLLGPAIIQIYRVLLPTLSGGT